MKNYPVLSPLFDGERKYQPGETVELDEGQAKRLQQIGVVGDALTIEPSHPNPLHKGEGAGESFEDEAPKPKPKAKK